MTQQPASVEVATSAVELLAGLLELLGQARAAGVARDALPSVQGAAALLSAEVVSAPALASSIIAAVTTALGDAGLGQAAGWLGLLTPAIQEWIAQASSRPLAGTTLSGVADLR